MERWLKWLVLFFVVLIAVTLILRQQVEESLALEGSRSVMASGSQPEPSDALQVSPRPSPAGQRANMAKTPLKADAAEAVPAGNVPNEILLQ